MLSIFEQENRKAAAWVALTPEQKAHEYEKEFDKIKFSPDDIIEENMREAWSKEYYSEEQNTIKIGQLQFKNKRAQKLIKEWYPGVDTLTQKDPDASIDYTQPLTFEELTGAFVFTPDEHLELIDLYGAEINTAHYFNLGWFYEDDEDEY